MFISGTVSNAFSIFTPILLLSSNEIPGKLTALTTNEPSLNSGKKLLPNWVNANNAKTKSPILENTTAFSQRIAFSNNLM